MIESDHILSGLAPLLTAADEPVFLERSRSPADTVERMRPFLKELGITRLGRQTGLDRLGIPCWAAFRPNSLSLSGSQGKGLTDDAARASALMEAVEVAIAERPHVRMVRASRAELEACGALLLDPERWLPFGTALAAGHIINWAQGTDLASGEPVWVPLDLVDMDGETSELDGLCKSSNGLASGNTSDEAVFHALCELVERDASTLWSFRSEAEAHATAIDPARFNDPLVSRLFAHIAERGFTLRLFDQTSDLGIPVVMAVLGPAGPGHIAELEIAAGYGAHPIAARAAIRAITEAAQSRVTAIAASRDDIHGTSFVTDADSANLRLLAAANLGPAPRGLDPATPLTDSIAFIREALISRCYRLVQLELAPPDLPVSVVRLFCPDLEDRFANLNWRPGPRTFDALSPS